MPSPVVLLPILQSLLGKRAKLDTATATPTFQGSGQAEQGKGKSVSPGLEGQINGRRSPWSRMKDYLWGQEDEGSRGEYIPNYRWTPILSGVIIPFAILLEIPGLTEHWYIRTIANKTVETQENPKILDAGMALSMASAVVANVALIMRFLERRVRLATCVAIGGLIIHDIINIVTITVFGVVHAVDDGFTYGQAFWMTVCSTIASLITTFSLVWDWVRTPEFARSGSGLTRKQRSLVIIVMVLLCYIALGALCYSFIIGVSFQNGLYFTVVSIETVGFGDIILVTTLGRIFSMFYNTFGIINLGLAVSTTRETIIESFENSYRKRRAQRDKLKHSRAQIRAAEQMLRRMGVPVYVPLPATASLDVDEKLIPAGSGIGERTMTVASILSSSRQPGPGLVPGGGRRHTKGSKDTLVLNIWALNQEQRSALFSDQGMGLTAGAGAAVGMGVVANVAAVVGASSGTEAAPSSESPVEPGSGSDPAVAGGGLGPQSRTDPDPATLIEQFHAELGGPGHEEESADYTELKEKLESEEKKEFAVKLGVAWSLFVAFWLIGSGVFMATEGWAFGSSMFFCFCTFSTVGYGDFAPKTPAGRAFFVGWALFGIAAMTILISVLTEAYSSRYKTIIHSGVLDRAVKSIRAQRRQRTNSHSHHPTSTNVVTADPNALAVEIISNARAIREHMSWFVNSTGMKDAPEGIIKVLDDIAEGENMDERVKKEFMGNDEARKTVFIMSFERMLHNLACAAEETARLNRQLARDRRKSE